MNITDKMKRDWDRRARSAARFWIATEAFESADVFADSGEQDTVQLIQGLEPYMDDSWQVLEVGCGIGRLLKPLARRFASVCGVDVSPEMIAQSKDWLRGLTNVETAENNGIDLNEWANNRFDLVFAYVAFQHMPKGVFESYLFDIHRVLKLQGWLKFQMFMGPTSAPVFEDTITLRVYNEQELHEKLDRAGFYIVDQTLRKKHNIGGVQCGDYFILARARQGPTPEIPPAISGLRTRECSDRVSATDLQMNLVLIKRHVKNGNHGAAIPLLQDVARLQPDQTDARLMLSNLLAMEHRLDEAIHTAKALIQQHANCYPGYVLLAKLYQSAGDRDAVSHVCTDLKQQLDALSLAYAEVTHLRDVDNGH